MTCLVEYTHTCTLASRVCVYVFGLIDGVFLFVVPVQAVASLVHFRHLK